MRVVVLAFALAQTLLPKPSAIQHIDVVPSANPSLVAKGQAVTLWADVTPKPNIHVYASDRQGFTPITLTFTPQTNVKFGTVKYPAPEVNISPGSDMLIPMYTKPFRLTQTATVSPSAKSGDVIAIAGVVKYEACNDKLCFPATTLPVTWAVTVK